MFGIQAVSGVDANLVFVEIEIVELMMRRRHGAQRRRCRPAGLAQPAIKNVRRQCDPRSAHRFMNGLARMA